MKEIRLFKDQDAVELSKLISRVFFEVNIRDYKKEDLQYWASLYVPEYLMELSRKSHMYVMTENDTIIGTCSITKMSEEDSLLEALYVHPERQREGNASAILEQIAQDTYFIGAKTIWVHSSITAREFYEKRGYQHETGEAVCIENDHYVMYLKSCRK